MKNFKYIILACPHNDNSYIVGGANSEKEGIEKLKYIEQLPDVDYTVVLAECITAKEWATIKEENQNV